ncbi:hypothetical protein FG379_001455 [Cryptosporidium bovis]|uniref:uncharacterized protein n=1 Tax=Cryptosporidium bovis TaxID=310047 RepID=UPI00351A7257|nr:hypothetical protein FG379_001455 [Cryptosporidium bovis]
MVTTFKLFLMVTILLFTIESSRGDQGRLQIKCSRSVSRKVNYSINQLIREETVFKKYMKQECPLNVEYHIYNSQETNKIVFPTGEVKCGICNELLNNNTHYDTHMDEIHMDNNNETEFICSEKFCMYFGVCEVNTKSDACNSLINGDNSIIDNCKKLIKNCFDLEKKDSRIYELEISHKICEINRILTLNKCQNNGNTDNTNIISSVLFKNFSMILLFIIIVSTFYISFKVNTYINKIK